LTVNIDNKAQNTKFAKVNLVNSLYASCCEIVSFLIKALNLPIDKEIATNLFSGIKTNTADFQSPNTSSTTFEIAAWCLQNGASKDHLKVAKTSAPFQPNQVFQPPTPAKEPPQLPSQPQTKAVQPPFTAPKQPLASQPSSQPTQPPPDWFKPKIFRGGSKF